MGRLFLAEIKRSWILFLRYPSEAITLVITFTAIFIGLFYGASFLAGPATTLDPQRLDSILVRYLLWSLTLYALTGMGWTIQNEAQAGTLEQVYLTPFGPVRVFLLRALADLLVQIGVIAVSFILILLISRRHLYYTPLVLLPLVMVMAATYGLGYILGGLTLLFKRIQNVLQLSQFALLFLVMAPTETWRGSLEYLSYLLPLTPGVNMINYLMVDRAPFDFRLLTIATLNGLAYFLIGMLVFQLSDRTAKRRGLLGGY